MSTDRALQTEQPRLTVPFLRQLRWNLILYFILLAVLPMAFTVIFALNQARTQTREQVRRQLESIVELKQDELIRWLNDSQFALSQFLSDPTRTNTLITFVKRVVPLQPQDDDSYQAMQNSLNDLLDDTANAQPLLEELFIYNTDGEVVAASNPVQISKTVAHQPYFADSLTEASIQTPYYEVGSGELTMFVTRPLIDDQSGQTVGVLAGRLDTNTLGLIMTERTGLRDSGETYLVSLENNYLLTPSRFENEGYILARAYRSEGINRALQQQNGFDLYENYRNVLVIGVYRWLPELQVAMLAEIDDAEALGVFVRTRNIVIALASFAALLAIIVGLYAATRISTPIVALTGIATQIAAGDLNQRVKMISQNEIGLLASAFNRMTDQLRDLIDSLEQRVVERTQRLGIVATLGEHLSAILNLEELLNEVVRQTKDNFGYYHTHIYLLDDKRERLVVVAGTGEAGAAMKAQGHHIPLNAKTSLVARAARTGEIVGVDNVREAEDWLPNPFLPNTYAEMAIPIILEAQVVGVLDVQADKVAGLDESDENVLRSLANQVAVAIRNAQLFEQARTALAEMHAAQEQYLERSWQKTKIVSRSSQYLYAQPHAAPLDEVKQQALAEARQQALAQNRPTVVTLNDDTSELKSLVAPINLGNKKIGALQLHSSTADQAWSEDDLVIIETIADQLAQAAENQRLFDETRSRADYERLVGEITQKIRQAPTLEILAKTASQELSKVLGVSYGIVRVGTTPKTQEPRSNGAS